MSLDYSIIIPVYNCAPYLEDCVSSILAQSYSNYEVLLIDDGSTDGSEIICDAMKKRDPRIRVFHKENGGAADARNLGLEHARGDYVIFVDGDDTIESDSLRQISSTSKAEYLTVFGISFDYYKNGALFRKKRLSCSREGPFTPAQIAGEFQSFFADNQLSSACNKLFDRSVIERHHLRFTKGMFLYEDFEFVVRYLLCVSKVTCLPAPLYHYRQTENGTHLNQRIADLKSLQANLSRLLQSLLTFFNKYPERSVASVAANLYLQLLDCHLLHRPKLKRSQLRRELPRYCGEPVFTEVLSLNVGLEDSSAQLLRRIQAGQYGRIAVSYRRRRFKAKGKRIAKKLLGK